jgi:uncharacterized protein
MNRDNLKAKEKKMKSLDLIVGLLLVVGGLNWGLVGLLNFNLVATLFGNASVVSRAVYAIVGICALYQVLRWKAMQHRWATA